MTDPTDHPPPTPQEPSGPLQEVLGLRVAGQDYAIPVPAVREIRGWTAATPLPHAAPEMLGVINLRGTVLPLIDLSVALGGPALEPGPRSVVVVIRVGEVQRGLLIDTVSDIEGIDPEGVQPPPRGARSAIAGLYSREEGLMRLLDADALVGAVPEAEL